MDRRIGVIMSATRLWNLSEFSKPNLPDVISEVYPYPYSKNSFVRVLDMPIQMPGQGIKFPDKLVQFEDVIWTAYNAECGVNRERAASGYIYVTVDQKPSPPGGTQRRKGWHGDGFLSDEYSQVDIVGENSAHMSKYEGLEVDHTYIVTDSIPTLFHPGPFDLTSSECDVVLKDFESVVKETPNLVQSYPEYTLLRLEPYDIHSAAPSSFDHPTPRTFMKVTFSWHRFNRTNNTRNPEFNYTGWNWAPRNPALREHRFTDLEDVR